MRPRGTGGLSRCLGEPGVSQDLLTGGARHGSHERLGDGSAYMDIFNINKDQLKDPDKIFPGQKLRIPA